MSLVAARQGYSLLPLEFREWVPKPKNDQDCWRWTGPHHSFNGYAIGTHGKWKGLPAVYWSWRLHFGALKSGYRVMPRCRNKSCVNPNHLMAVPRR